MEMVLSLKDKIGKYLGGEGVKDWGNGGENSQKH